MLNAGWYWNSGSLWIHLAELAFCQITRKTITISESIKEKKNHILIAWTWWSAMKNCCHSWKSSTIILALHCTCAFWMKIFIYSLPLFYFLVTDGSHQYVCTKIQFKEAGQETKENTNGDTYTPHRPNFVNVILPFQTLTNLWWK